MQLITAIQIKLTTCKDAQADLILSDHSVNAQFIGERLRTCGIFSRVQNIQSTAILYEQGKLADLLDVLRVTFHLGNKFKSMLWPDAAYQQIFYFNQGDLLPTCALPGLRLFSKWFPETAKTKAEKAARLFCNKVGVYSTAKRVYKTLVRK